MQSVGRMLLTLKKKSVKRWSGLYADPSQKKSNQGVWWELYEKYEKEMPMANLDKEEPAKKTTKKKKKKSKKKSAG